MRNKISQMSQEDLELFLDDIDPSDLDDEVYTDIGSIDKGFIKVYLTIWDYEDGELKATLYTDEYGDYICKGYKNYSYDRWVWYSWEKE